MSRNTEIFNKKKDSLVRAAPLVKLKSKSEMELIEKLIDLFRQYVGEPVATNGTLYCYLPETGMYAEVDRPILRGIVQEFSQVRYAKAVREPKKRSEEPVFKTTYPPWNYSVAVAKSIGQGLLNNLGILKEDGYFGEVTPGVNFHNCFLKVTGEAIEVLEHDPQWRIRTGYEIDYQEDGREPEEYLEFLRELFLEDEDCQEKIQLLQEYLGLCIIGQAAIKGQKALLAIGGGANGKSALQFSWRVVMPPGAVVTVPPSEFADPNAVKRLDGALLNISEELPTKRSRAEDVLKASIAGGFVLGNKKYHDKAEFRSIAGHFFGANSWPDVTDQTEGFRRRFVPISFNRTFNGDDAAHRKPWNVLVEMFYRERTAIVSWAIKGAQRFLANNNQFTELPGHKELMKEWMGQAHPVANWVEDELEVKKAIPAPKDADKDWYKDNWAYVGALHDAYLRWCEDMKIRHVLNRISFGRKLTELGIGRSAYGSRSYRQLKIVSTGADVLDFSDLDSSYTKKTRQDG